MVLWSIRNGEVPVVEPFDLESSQMATKRVDLQPYFAMGKPGRYKVTATVRIKAWSLAITSAPKHFDVINGAELWSQVFGVVVATNAAPEPRKYALVEANYLREQLRLYVEVSTADGAHVFKVAALGPLVSFSAPEAQVDRVSQLHVLWQTGAQSFSYTIVSPDGTMISRDTYENFNSRPRLTVNDSGEVVVKGGVRRSKPTDFDLPGVKSARRAGPAVKRNWRLPAGSRGGFRFLFSISANPRRTCKDSASFSGGSARGSRRCPASRQKSFLT